MSESSAGPRRVADLISRADPATTAIIDGDRRLTYRELDGAVDVAAAALMGAGLGDGARVALQLGTGIDFAVLYLAASRAGLVAVPLNPAYTLPEVSYALADSGAELLITTADAVPAGIVRTISGAAELTSFLSAADLSSATDAAEASLSATQRLAVLLYTSGTSGRPRGAMLTDRALLANLEQLATLDPPAVSSTDRVFVPIPLFHIFGLNCGLGVTLHAGATAVFSDQFDAEATLAAMASHRITAVVGVPRMFAAWSVQPGFGQAFATVRFAGSGSAPLSASILRRYEQAGVTLHEGYGVTEAAPAITTNWSAPGGPKPGSVGRPLPGVEIELRDAVGEPVEDDDAGELFVRGANLFSGYWPDGADGPDAEGWFSTGDIGFTDSDGDLYLIGRTSDLVIVSGFNVYPAEVEAVLRAIDGIEEVAVLGVPDAVTGEAVVAYVVAAPGVELDPTDVLATAARSLARFKLPSAIEIRTQLPHTVTGKVMKWRLREASIAAG